jgi:hypothetical protein
MLHCDYCSAFILEFAMNDVVEHILSTYQSMCPLDAPTIKVSAVRHGVTEITLSDGRLVRATLHVAE